LPTVSKSRTTGCGDAGKRPIADFAFAAGIADDEDLPAVVHPISPGMDAAGEFRHAARCPHGDPCQPLARSHPVSSRSRRARDRLAPARGFESASLVREGGRVHGVRIADRPQPSLALAPRFGRDGIGRAINQSARSVGLALMSAHVLPPTLPGAV